MAKQMTEMAANNGHVDAKPTEVMTPAPRKIEIDVEKCKQWGKDNPLKVIGTALMLLASLIWWFYPRTPGVPATHFQPAVAYGGVYAPSPVPAAGPAPTPASVTVASNQQLTMLVASVGQTGTNKFLNSLPDYKAAGNQVIMLTGGAASLNHHSFVGRTVTATGELKRSARQTFLSVSNPAAVLVK